MGCVAPLRGLSPGWGNVQNPTPKAAHGTTRKLVTALCYNRLVVERFFPNVFLVSAGEIAFTRVA